MLMLRISPERRYRPPDPVGKHQKSLEHGSSIEAFGVQHCWTELLRFSIFCGRQFYIVRHDCAEQLGFGISGRKIFMVS